MAVRAELALFVLLVDDDPLISESLAFALEEMNVGPDTFERELDATRALPIVANRRPQTEVLFPDVEPRPYMYWGPMQDVRVRYFRGEGPRRFTGPDAGTPAE